MHQIKVGPHDYQGDEGSCVLPIDADSWQQTHVIPLRAAVDYMADGEVWTNLTLKLKVQGRTIYNFKHNVSTKYTTHTCTHAHNARTHNTQRLNAHTQIDYKMK